MEGNGLWRKTGKILVLTAVFSIVPCFFEASQAAEETRRIWDFSEGAQGWQYDDSWSGDSYTGGGSCEYDEEKGMLRLSLDYSLNQDNGYSQTGISLAEEGGIDYSSYRALNFDLYYDPEAFHTGSLTVKAFANNIFRDQSCAVNKTYAEDVNGLKLVNLSLECDPQYTVREQPEKLMIQLIGNQTDYHGYVWIDNIMLTSVKPEKFLKETSVPIQTETVVEETGEGVRINGDEIVYPREIRLADPQADDRTAALYQYLKAVGESDGALYGHMEDTVLKAGADNLTESDTMDATGSLAAVVGMDCGGMFSGFASKYNERHPGAGLPDTNEGNIQAAALFSNEAIARGSIITLSSHMPNFSASVKREGEFKNSYDGFDFSPADSYQLTGNCMNEILPGGLYHEAFCAHLDVIADYARQVDGPILFRPFHENTGSWFWWGKAFCDPVTYQNVFRYTVEYLRDEKQVHNLLYLYGPGSEAANAAEYGERYPGDDWVDMIGFDSYDNNPVPDEEGYVFQENFENSVRLTDAFAKEHGKLFAVTETGMSFAPDGGITEAGNRRPEWYSEILEILTKPEYDCCYFMLWSNYSRAGSYYSPFVTEVRENGRLFGHELLDSFIAMYNNKKSIFAADQQTVLKNLFSGVHKAPELLASDQLDGYITAPVGGTRLLGETVITARMSRQVSEAKFRIEGNGQEIEIPAEADQKTVRAVLDADDLQKIGEAPDGRIVLFAEGTRLQEIPVILNIEPAPDDPLLVDDFESYAGLADMLSASWSVSKDSSCDAAISLTDVYSEDGSYALQFGYTETGSGWAGCEFSKETDWSDCNALQFWVMPDENYQKTVVQIKTASGGNYEAYLQEYPEYASASGALLVTLPFDEFIDKGGKGRLTGEETENVTGLGLWINAISGSSAIGQDGMVRGTICYDDIRAVRTDITDPVFKSENYVQVADGEADNDAEIFGKNEASEAEAASAEESGNGRISAGRRIISAVSGLAAVLSLICLILLALGTGRKKQ